MTVEQMQWDGSEESQRAIVNWSKGVVSGWFDSVYFLRVPNAGGEQRAEAGDYVVRDEHGAFSVVRSPAAGVVPGSDT